MTVMAPLMWAPQMRSLLPRPRLRWLWGGQSPLCLYPALGILGGLTDCDESDFDVNPSALEICDRIDNDCNLLVDDNVIFTDYYLDGWDFGDANGVLSACAQPSGYSNNSTDCDDSNINVNPAAAELCNGIDDDCDGTVDVGHPMPWPITLIWTWMVLGPVFQSSNVRSPQGILLSIPIAMTGNLRSIPPQLKSVTGSTMTAIPPCG